MLKTLCHAVLDFSSVSVAWSLVDSKFNLDCSSTEMFIFRTVRFIPMDKAMVLIRVNFSERGEVNCM